MKKLEQELNEREEQDMGDVEEEWDWIDVSRTLCIRVVVMTIHTVCHLSVINCLLSVYRKWYF